MEDQSALRVDIVSDVVCPWCVIGYHQLAKAAQETGTSLEICWHPFELNPQMPPDGENLREHLAAKYVTTLEGSIKSRARLTELGAALGFEFNYADDMRMVNTFRAHQLIDLAAEHGKAHEAQMALFRAFFGRRENLTDPKVLVRIAAEIGLEPNVARDALENETFANTVRQKEHFWIERGVTGVPAMLFEKQHLMSGAQGEGNYARALKHLMELKAVSHAGV